MPRNTQQPTAGLTTLYRPTGAKELELIYLAGMKSFPPRLLEQPIFYPVMNQDYAAQIARDWNTKSEPDYIGFVLGFEVETEYLIKFKVETVGASHHQELWVPAEELEEFNRHIAGPIRILEVFQGEKCQIEIDDAHRVPKSWLHQTPTAEVLYQGRFIRVKKQGRWEYVERCKTTGIVAILAVTPKNEIILVEQYRLPVNKRVIEIPAGLAGDIEGEEHEAMAEAAERELLEETGYEADRMEFLTEGPPSAGLSTEIITFFHAQGLKKVADGGGDGSEDIQVHLVPLDKLKVWIDNKQREGCLVDYKIYATLYFLK